MATEDREPDSLERAGPWQLTRELGRGGMGTVYRGVHIDDPARVAAVKCVDALHSTVLDGLRREIAALARLDHPGIVRVLDHGTTPDGRPWYAMELLEGETLRAWLARSARQRAATPPRDADTLLVDDEVVAPGATDAAGTAETMGPDTIPARPAPAVTAPDGPAAGARDIVPTSTPPIDAQGLLLFERLCWTLAWLHGEGLVHRDVKPENVIVRSGPDGSPVPVLLDFGLAVEHGGDKGRERLTERLGEAAGTARYMAPEQIEGSALDARTDLYAVGCMLHELITGAPPYDAAAPLLVLGQHLRAPIPALPAATPPRLRQLVRGLMAKRAEDRPGYAADVARRLAAVRGDSPSRLGPRPRVALYRARLVGRDDEMRALTGHLDGLSRERGAFVVIDGERGSGRTRLLLELVAAARRANLEIAAAPVQSGAGALEPLRGLMRNLARRARRGVAVWDRAQVAAAARVLGAFEPALLAAAAVADTPDPPALSPAEARLRAVDALVTLVELTSTRRPLVLAVDDAHLADDWSLDALSMVLRAGICDRVPLLVVLTSLRADGACLVSERLDIAGAERLTLVPLDARGVAAQAESMLAATRPLPTPWVETLTARSHGNPFYVSTWLHTALHAGALHRDVAGHWHLVDVDDPGALDTVQPLQALLARRLADLDADARELVRTLAVIGDRVDLRLLSEVVGDRTLPGLHALHHGGLVELERSAEADAARFAGAGLRALVLESLDDRALAERHGRVADALLRRGGDDSALAHHLAVAGRPDEAFAAHSRAARAALARHAPADAVRHLEAALALGVGARTHARLELAGALVTCGRGADALPELERVVEVANRDGDTSLEAEARLCQARAERLRGELPTAAAVLESMADHPALADAPVLAARRHDALGAIYLDLHALERARRHARAALELADAHGVDGTLAASSWETLAIAAFFDDRFDEADDALERSRRKANDGGDRTREATALGTRAAFAFRGGRYAEAVADFEAVIELHRAVGNRSMEATALANLASARRMLGRLTGTEQLYTRAMALQQRLGDARSEAISLSNLGTLRHETGELDAASENLQDALARHRTLGNRRWETYTLVWLAQLERHRGHLIEAVAALDAAEPLLAEVGERRYLALAACERGHLALAATPRDLDAATRSLASARSHASELEAGSVADKACDVLDAACAVARQAGALVAGQREADLPDGVRRALRIS